MFVGVLHPMKESLRDVHRPLTPTKEVQPQAQEHDRLEKFNHALLSAGPCGLKAGHRGVLGLPI